MEVWKGLALLTLLSSSHTVSAFLLDGDNTKTVHTKYGDIVGNVRNAQFDGRDFPVARFLGIPYAEPPVGDLRFRKPVPVKTLTTPFMANRFGNSCIGLDIGIPHGTMSEDCLFLNIFAPVDAGNAGVPLKTVMIWIHGGGFVTGESNTYEGDVISGYGDVIIVTLNYRLGPFGFFSMHDENARGNYGLWDQYEVVSWVLNNIYAFGGDRDKVTLFGESAGAASVFYQLKRSGSKNRINRAIIESGAPAPWAYAAKGQNRNASLEFAYAIGCNYTSTDAIMICIRSKSSTEARRAFNAVQNITRDFYHTAWVPVHDRDFFYVDPAIFLQNLMSNDPDNIVNYDEFLNVDLLVGTNSYDGAVLLPLLYDNPDILRSYSADNLQSDIGKLLEFSLKRKPSQATIDAAVYKYTNVTGNDNALDSLIRATNDIIFSLPAVVSGYAHWLHCSRTTYLYEFSVAPPGVYNPLPAYLQHDPRAANHFDEVMYVFGFPSPIARGLYNISGPIDPANIRVAEFMMTTWTNFAKTGIPNTPTDLRVQFNVTWPQYSHNLDFLPRAALLPYLDITRDMSENVSVKFGFAEKAVDFWINLLPNYFGRFCVNATLCLP